jgi:hypothetical protein
MVKSKALLRLAAGKWGGRYMKGGLLFKGKWVN